MFKRLMRSERLQKRTIWILLLFLIPPFLFFFSGGDGAGGPEGAAGIVFGRTIPSQRYQEMYRLVRQNVERQLNGPVPESFEPYVRDQAWDRITLSEEARRRITISDEALARHIQTVPTFQQNGRFSRDLYFRYVRALGYSPQTFEEHLRDDLRIQQLVDGVNAEVAIGEPELKDAFAKEQAKLRAAIVLVREQDLRDHIRRTLTEEDVRQAYARFADRIRIPAMRNADMIALRFDEALRQQPEPTEEALRAYYDAHPEELKDAQGAATPFEQATESLRERVRAEGARRRLTEVALDFEDSRDQGVRLEEAAQASGLPIQSVGPIELWRVPGDLPPAVAEPVFDAPIGRLTTVVKTPEGVYLLRPVLESPSVLPALDEVRSRIEQMLLDERTREAAQARAGQLREEAAALRQGGATVDQIAQTLGVTPARPDPFTKTASLPELGLEAGQFDAFFDASPGQVSDVAPTATGSAFACVEERIPPTDEEFAAGRDAFKTTYEDRRRQERLTEWMSDLRQRAGLKSLLDAPTN
jgi:peptidyl-prolyl cis-trans isomerase D